MKICKHMQKYTKYIKYAKITLGTSIHFCSGSLLQGRYHSSRGEAAPQGLQETDLFLTKKLLFAIVPPPTVGGTNTTGGGG